MKFLVDQQLPPALAGFIESQGHIAQHVRELGLKEAEDRIIWRLASENDMIIVSKDEDFYFFASVPENKVKLLWLRMGNCRTSKLLETFKTQLPGVITAFESGSVIVEIR